MTVVVQDKENKKITEYKDVCKFRIDTNYMYLTFSETSETKATTIFRRYMKLVEIKED